MTSPAGGPPSAMLAEALQGAARQARAWQRATPADDHAQSGSAEILQTTQVERRGGGAGRGGGGEREGVGFSGRRVSAAVREGGVLGGRSRARGGLGQEEGTGLEGLHDCSVKMFAL